MHGGARDGRVVSDVGILAGGGMVGFGSQFDRDNFFRDAGEIGYNITLSGMGMRHNLHAGYQRSVDSEDLTRSSNGWGSITVPGGRTSFQGTPIFYAAAFQQQTLQNSVPTIHSEFRSQSIEVNDTINWKNWTYNVGLLASNDTLYGQGLQNAPNTLSGFVLATGTTTKSRQSTRCTRCRGSKLIQPRLSATYAYNGRDTVFASYAQVQPDGQLAAARRVVGPQPRDDDSGVLRRQRQPVRGRSAGLLVGQAVRAEHDAADAQRIPVRHRAAVRPEPHGARLLPLQPRLALLGRHQQQRPQRVQPAGDAAGHRRLHPDDGLHPESERRCARRSASRAA